MASQPMVTRHFRTSRRDHASEAEHVRCYRERRSLIQIAAVKDYVCRLRRSLRGTQITSRTGTRHQRRASFVCRDESQQEERL